jgi:GGDEF domain-containing protein
MADRRTRPGSDTTLVYVELDGAERHDPRGWDDLLASTVQRLRVQLRRGDSVGRYGDGILTLLCGVHAQLGEQVARRMLESLDIPVAASAVVEEVAPGEGLDDAATRARSA